MFAKWLPFWLPKPEIARPGSKLVYRDLSNVEKLAWHWQFINRHLDRGAALYPERYRRVAFERLFARDGAGLAEFVEWVGLPASAALAQAANGENVNASRTRAGSRWRDWSDRDKRALLHFCGADMERYGYDLSGDSAFPGADAMSVGTAAAPALF
jgi:hypothetical protein